MIPILALIGSAALQPLWLVFARHEKHPITVNFWALCLTVVILSPLYFVNDLPLRIVEHLPLVISLSVFQACYAISALVFTKNNHFQLAYPLIRLGPIFILIGEVIFLGQNFSNIQILGILLSSLGAMQFGLDQRLVGIRKKYFLLLGMVLLFSAISMLLAKQTLTYFSPAEMWTLGIFQIPISLLAIMIFKQTTALKQDFKKFKTIILIFLSMTGSWYLALFAMQFFPVAIVASVRSISVLMGVFLGGKLFLEGHSLRVYLASILIILGILFSLTG